MLSQDGRRNPHTFPKCINLSDLCCQILKHQHFYQGYSKDISLPPVCVCVLKFCHRCRKEGFQSEAVTTQERDREEPTASATTFRSSANVHLFGPFTLGAWTSGRACRLGGGQASVFCWWEHVFIMRGCRSLLSVPSGRLQSPGARASPSSARRCVIN